MPAIKYWFALYTKSRHEFKAKEQISSENITCYLPTITKLKQWSDRKKKIIEPLFKSYIFIQANEKERLKSVEFDSIVKTIFFDGKPSVIPDYQILNLKNLLENTNTVNVFNEVVKGQYVKIVDGPFKDIEGVVYSINKNESMLAVTIDLLRRSVVVKLPSQSVTKNIGKY